MTPSVTQHDAQRPQTVHKRTNLSVLAGFKCKHVTRSRQSFIFTVFFYPSSCFSYPHHHLWISNIDGKPSPAVQALQTASAGPCILQSWLEHIAWKGPRATGQWNTEQWSWSNTVVRQLWSEPLAALIYRVAHVRHHPCQRLLAGLSRSPADGSPSRPNALDTKTLSRRMRLGEKRLDIGGHESGFHEGIVPLWGDVLSEGCSWGMQL